MDTPPVAATKGVEVDVEVDVEFDVEVDVVVGVAVAANCPNVAVNAPRTLPMLEQKPLVSVAAAEAAEAAGANKSPV